MPLTVHITMKIQGIFRFLRTFGRFSCPTNTFPSMKRTKIKELLKTEPSGQEVIVQGWVRFFRNNQFIAINDGSTLQNIQAVIDFGNTDESLIRRIVNGACISIKGDLVPSQGKGQNLEVKVKTLEILGDCDPNEYPFQLKNRPSPEFLREIAHLRPRTNTFGAVM